MQIPFLEGNGALVLHTCLLPASDPLNQLREPTITPTLQIRKPRQKYVLNMMQWAAQLGMRYEDGV